MELKEATLYTAFRRLEAAETSGARRRYYAITALGQEKLISDWRRGRRRNASLTSYWRDDIMCKEIFAFRRVTPFSDFSLAERLIGDTISWEEISRQRLQNAIRRIRRNSTMRNETVERIVNLLFQDVEMTDEVQALYDETMSNCQERYQDMTSRGLSDDDAIAAVVESLKGMEDVISQYPKKSESPEAEEAPKSADVPVDDDGDASRRISLSIRRILGASK